MNLVTTVLPGLAAGGAIGALYFGWLWWSLSGLTSGRGSAAGFALQALARYVVAAAGFALVAHGLGWPAVAAALAGFVGARVLLQRRLGGAHDGAVGRPASSPSEAPGRPEGPA